MAVFKTPQLPDDLDPGTLTDGMAPLYDVATERWVPGVPDSGTSGSSNLLVVSGSVTLDDGVDVGTLVGYRTTASTTFTGQGGSVTLAAGAHIFERVTGGWTYRTIDEGTGLITGPPETTPPVAGTLAVTGVTHEAATLTVAGASDAGSGLHGSPYGFSTNNGTTWTSWQTSNVYAATGLIAAATYTFRHKVRDAQGNETVGTAVQATTEAAPPPEPETLFTDTFTATDNTNVVGRTLNGYTWAADSGTPPMWSQAGAQSAKIVGNKAVSAAAPTPTAHIINVGSHKVRISCDYTVPATAGARVSLAVALGVPASNGFMGIAMNVYHTGNANVSRGAGNSSVTVGDNSLQTALTGTMVLEYDGATIKAWQNGVQFVSVAYVGLQASVHAGFLMSQYAGISVDNLEVVRLP